MSEPKGRVLLVEDDETTRNAMFRLLQMGGLDVVTAASVTEACQILKTIQPPPICLLVDLLLPDGCGSEVIAEARRVRFPAKVVILSGSILPPEFTDLQTRLNPDAVFMKPVNFGNMIEWIQQHCIVEASPAAPRA